MTIYPVQISNKSTIFIKATKAAITAKMKSLGIKNFSIENPVGKNPKLTPAQNKVLLSKVKLTPLSQVKASVAKFFTEGKLPGGANNPGMKNNFVAQSKLAKNIKKVNLSKGLGVNQGSGTKNRGGGNTTTTTKINVKSTTAGPTKANVDSKKLKAPVKNKTSTTTTTANQKKVTLNKKIRDLAKKVKAKAPNISMSKILDTIRTQIRKRPLTAVGVGTGVGFGIATILEMLRPSKIADATLTKVKSGVPLGPNIPKSNTNGKGGKNIDSKDKSSSVSITITTPVKKPERYNDKKKITDKNGSGAMFSLIVGGKGTAKQRFAEIAIEEKLEKKLGRRPDRKELLAQLKKSK